MRPPALRIHAEELVVDNFAGGGGASTGLEWALQRSPDFAINHDPEAIAMHSANHPRTKHFCEDVFAVNPREVCGSKRIALAWFSPDCTFFSKAKGGAPFRDPEQARKRRGLAGVVIRWASLPKANKPRVILMENVEEFQDWGPLGEDGRPDKVRRGLSFRRWLGRLKGCGYEVETRELVGADYGAPTTRRRLFVVARSDGLPIVWPRPTHGPGLIPHRAAAECIEWALLCPSIFDRKKPLAENTQKRIARGLRRYVLEAPEPFIIPLTHHWNGGAYPVREPMRTVTAAHRGELAMVSPYIARIGQTGGNGKYVNDARQSLTTVTTKAEHLLVAAGLIHRGNGEREGQAPRIYDLDRPHPTVVGSVKTGIVAAFLARHYGGPRDKDNHGIGAQLPLPTITTKDHHALVASHLLKLRGGLADHGVTGQDVRAPLATVTAGGMHHAEVRAFLIKYYGTDQDPQLGLPMHTVTTKDRFGLVTVAGEDYAIADIGMRMLVPRELFRAQGFRDSYLIDVPYNGKPLTKTSQVRLCGNSVNPDVAQWLAIAQLSDNPVGSTAEVA